MAIIIESLKAVPYLDTEHLGDGGAVNRMPLWDEKNWRMCIDTPGGLIEIQSFGGVGDLEAARSPIPVHALHYDKTPDALKIHVQKDGENGMQPAPEFLDKTLLLRDTTGACSH